MIIFYATMVLADTPCSTLEHLNQFDPVILMENTRLDTELVRSDKQEREAVANLSNSRASDNFIVKWNGNVDSQAIDRLIDAFELSWQIEIEEMGHPAPQGTNQYLFNVYVGDSGGNAPSGGGAAGYFTYDNDYYPMIVVAKSTLESPEYADITAAHEFYHAIQGGTFRYNYDEDSPGGWFWEATATWASAEVYPENLYYSSFLFSYALLPTYPVDYFNYPDTGTIDEYYQYGSFIFPLDISMQVGQDIIRDTWTDSTNEPDPIEVIRKKLEAEGIDFNEFWMDHSARMTQYDFPNGEQYQEMVNSFASGFPDLEDVVAASHTGSGTGGWVDVPETHWPGRYGYTQVKLELPNESAYQIAVQPDNVSSLGNIAFYSARIIIDDGFTLEYVDLPVDGESTYVSGIDMNYVITIVVGSWSSEWSPGTSESFGFSYLIAPDEWSEGEPSNEPGSEYEPPETNNDTVEDAPKSGCACATTGEQPSTIVGVFALLMIWTGRRRTLV